VAAKVVSKIERGRPATSVHGFVLNFFFVLVLVLVLDRPCDCIIPSPVNALLGKEFGNG
jgi:hypothetical protein